MARRRSKKSPFARRLAAWRKLPRRIVTGMLAYRPPHSSVFVIGIGIGLAVGLSIGVGLTWLDGHQKEMPAQGATVPEPPPPMLPAPVPPVYTEQTEPPAPEAEEAPNLDSPPVI